MSYRIFYIARLLTRGMEDISFQHPVDYIIATLSFFSLFDYPLTAEEIQKYCLSYSLDLETIRELCTQNPSITLQDNLYCLTGKEYQRKLRRKHDPIIQQRIQKAQRYGRLLRFIPFVRGVFLCNNLSFGVVTDTGDIDLFIVSDSKHLWITRFLVTIFLHFLRVRRHGQYIQNRICLSFFTTETHLDLTSIAQTPQDIYLAYWVLGLRPLVGWDIYNSILQENEKWLTKYYNIVNLHTKWQEETVVQNQYQPHHMLQRLQEWGWQTRVGRWLEERINVFQKRHMEKRYAQLSDKKGVIISEHMLKFHNEDKRSLYQREWKKTFMYFSHHP